MKIHQKFLLRYFFMLNLACLFGILTGCNNVRNSSESPPLKIAWSLYPGYSPFAIAIEQDLFSKHGVSVNPILYTVSADQLPDFEAGKIDGGFFAFADALTIDSRLRGEAKLVLVADNSDGADLVVAAADIRTLQDLKGKKIGTGIGSFRELLVRQMLEINGMTVEDVDLINIGPDEVPAAIPDKIQAGQTWDPFTFEAIAKGAHVIFTSHETPGLIPDVLVFHTYVLQQRPEEVRGVIAAWFEALTYWEANPADGNALIAKATGKDPTGVSTEGINLFTLEENQRAFTDSTDPISLYFSGKINADFMLSTGVLNSAPDLRRFLDPSFLPASP